MISLLQIASSWLPIFHISLVFLVLALWRFLWKWNSLKNRVRKIPGPVPRFPIGNMPIQVVLFNKFTEMVPAVLLHYYALGFSMIYRKTKILSFWLGMTPYVLFFDYNACEALLSSTKELDKTFEYSFLHDWLGTGLLTSTGRKWKTRRKMLTPSFHFRILDHFQEVFNEQSLVFVENIKRRSEKDRTLDVSPAVTLLTLDIICETAMGTKLGVQESKNAHYLQALQTVGTIFMERVLRPFLWPRWIFKISPSGRTFYKNLKVLHNFTNQVIRNRKNQNVSVESQEQDGETKRRLVFMDILLQEQKTSGLTDEDIREEVDTFMFEGHDTTSVGISWALFLIGHHPEVQRKIREELEGIFGNNCDMPITSKELKEMKYLECVLKECQRLYPSVPLIGRILKEDMVIGEHTIPAGTTCIVFPPGLHRDPKVFPNPEIFDPERFFPENVSGRHPYAYVPFSAGPRNCIGQKFALNEEKTVVAQCLRHFTLRSVAQLDQIPVAPELVSRPSQPLLVQFIDR